MTRDRQPDSRMSPGAPEADGDAGLEAFFAAARAVAPEPSPGLHHRVLRDAGDVLAGRSRGAAARQATGTVPRTVWLADLWAALGGWAGGSGLAAATVAGLAVGFGIPGAVPALTGGAAVTVSDAAATDATDDTTFVTWLWPGVGTVIDDLSAGLMSPEEG